MRRLWPVLRPLVDASPMPWRPERPAEGSTVRHPYVAPSAHWHDLVEGYPQPHTLSPDDWERYWFWRDY